MGTRVGAVVNAVILLCVTGFTPACFQLSEINDRTNVDMSQSDTDVDTDTDGDADTDSDANTDTDTDSDTESNSAADIDVDTDADTEADNEADTAPDYDPVCSEASVPSTCEETHSWVGCCLGNVVYWWYAGAIYFINCSELGQLCGWDPINRYYCMDSSNSDPVYINSRCCGGNNPYGDC
jgi:hypothetical protein